MRVIENKLQIFENEVFGKVRILEVDDKPYFVANDVARALGYKNPSDATNTHCKKAIMTWGSDSLGRHQEFKVIPESDIYRLITRSKLPSAEEFESWVFDEVLPTIRKTGGYVQENRETEFIENYFPSFTEDTKLAMVLDLHGQTLKFKKELEEQKPLVDFANQVSNTSDLIDMGRMAKLLKDEHINIGRNRLFEWLRANEILMKNNTPYQRFVEGGYFKVKESVKETAYGDKTYVTTYVTGKGQIYITEKLRKEFTEKKAS